VIVKDKATEKTGRK